MARDQERFVEFNVFYTMVLTCKTCRRLGVSVCGKTKCALQRKPYPPGASGKRTSKFRGGSRGLSDYGKQLREKQILKFLYGLREKQFRNYVLKAIATKEKNSIDELLALLESRLDNVVYRLGFAGSRSSARQIVLHGHIQVNDRRVNIPSYHVRTGDKIRIRPQSTDKGVFKDLDLYLKKYNTPKWLSLDKTEKIGEVKGVVYAGDVDVPASVNTIIEYYSR
ncbi:MAG: 30S ribosomal protein S4 [Candidatus Niyogibacteria bacterium CG10_big_fil_rev_8_21_14_0_10_42_19]|uniref:Small ribosomal subunit protein uS4 n=1 Tax=Candidatus Niyogibacteria bacterium CG10_big_fil_rev_8_21_14_0_10_42_19 TaxID=1974725 RepID=A0A2H0TFP9_9BACT|nr:MAG: 30S ribosomal protein S4 [Candidatus Niyogibacteria bacterium CG10_big_fil_rev_8_21_14_0_10_42_19]